jgi:hypothetical protein
VGDELLINTYIFYTTKIGESRIITNPSIIPCNGKSMGKAMDKSMSKAMDKSMSTIMTK